VSVVVRTVYSKHNQTLYRTYQKKSNSSKSCEKHTVYAGY